MHGYTLKIGAFLFCFTLALACLCRISAAQSEEEMLILRMYYKEKDLVVVSPTRYPKPISQVAENITVITAKEIEGMNAHTVADVLNKVPGIFISFNQDFGASSSVFIQGSEARHTLVLVDGISWNLLSEGSAETNSIPVGIIERIEVIKGPASSAWGSSLGGVINIITKQAGNTERSAGSMRASYGERSTQDYRIDFSGLAGPVGYYLFAGRQESDGLMSSRYFNNDSFYAKFNIPVARDVDVGMSIGYSEPHINFFGDLMEYTGDSRTFFTTASLDASLTKDLGLNLSFYIFKQKPVFNVDISNYIYDEETTGGSSKLVWTQGMHTAVLGIDFDYGKLDQTEPALPTTSSHIDKWAIYVNDTITIDGWSITPGIRYDYNSITGSFISPSLGLTYELGEDSILRASVARGFTLPPLSWTSGGGLFLNPNPSLEPEKVWSYQAGVESAIAKYLWIKATFFRHDLENAVEPSELFPMFINEGKIRRQGIEFEAETMPIHNLSLLGGFSYVRKKPSSESKPAAESHSYNIGVKYDDKESFEARLSGHYMWWGLDSFFEANDNDFIWDLNINKKIYSREKTATEIFLTVHNIFNGVQYDLRDDRCPERWVEAGIRVKF